MGKHAMQAVRVYDLKGSTFQRITVNPHSERSVRKDLNFLDDKDYRVALEKKTQTDILERIAKDKEFLKQCYLMDYSMFIVFFRKDAYYDGSSNGEQSYLSQQSVEAEEKQGLQFNEDNGNERINTPLKFG